MIRICSYRKTSRAPKVSTNSDCNWEDEGETVTLDGDGYVLNDYVPCGSQELSSWEAQAQAIAYL